ncbi:MAG TPA: alpha/beta hydrolase [Thermoanaerobaculia bacterium]|jgi:predicted alpha/beta hydrolase family esterase|nr:alpha/beta hydrolase [Thermoanaerobaculia bacterium]
MKARALMVPGLWNSGPEHWQTFWERAEPAWQRIQQADWETPLRADWVAAIDAAVQAAPVPVVLVAHSLRVGRLAGGPRPSRPASPRRLTASRGMIF